MSTSAPLLGGGPLASGPVGLALREDQDSSTVTPGGVVAYPASLPAVLQASKTRTQPAAFRLNGARRGTGYVQKIGTTPPVFWDVTWRFTRAQAAQFAAWFVNDIRRGADTFTMAIRTEFGLIDHVCQFLPDGMLTTQDTGEVWTYSASIMAREFSIPQDYIDLAQYIVDTPNWDGTIVRDLYWPQVRRLVQFDDTTTGAAFFDWKTLTAGELYSDGSVETYVTRTNSPGLGAAPSMRWTYQATGSFSNRILRFPASADHAIPSGENFTVEAWVRGPRSSTDGQGWITLMRAYTVTSASGTADWEFVLQSGNYGPASALAFVPAFVINDGILIRASGVTGVTNTQWHHVAISRQGTDWKVFLNGVSTAVTTPQGDPSGFPGPYGSASSKLCLMGREDNSGNGVPNCYGFGSGSMSGPDAALDGYLGAARLTVGVARYWFDFDPGSPGPFTPR